jgi:hypothetical protein
MNFIEPLGGTGYFFPSMKKFFTLMLAGGLLILAACSTTQVQTFNTNISKFNAWAASPQVSSNVRKGEILAGSIVDTIAAVQGSTRTQNELYGAGAVLTAYGTNPVPVNVLTDTVAAVPQLTSVLVPLAKNPQIAAKIVYDVAAAIPTAVSGTTTVSGT